MPETHLAKTYDLDRQLKKPGEAHNFQYCINTPRSNYKEHLTQHVDEITPEVAKRSLPRGLPVFPLKLTNPYSKQHSLESLRKMVLRVLQMPQAPYLGITTITSSTLRRIEQLVYQKKKTHTQLLPNKLILRQPGRLFESGAVPTPLCIAFDATIGRGAVSLVSRTSDDSLAAKIQITEFHLPLRELCISQVYKTRTQRSHAKPLMENVPSVHMPLRTSSRWILPVQLIYATAVRDGSALEGNVAFDIEATTVTTLLGTGSNHSLDQIMSVNWCFKRKRCDQLSTSLLLLPTPRLISKTLLEFSNLIHHSSQSLALSSLMTEDVYLYICYQLLSLIEDLHHAEIIHGDVKPDNFLIFNEASSVEPIVICGIDYGRSLDLQDSLNWFVGSCHANGFQTPHMICNLPWSYGIDYYGLFCTIHVLLVGRYVKALKVLPSKKNGSTFHHASLIHNNGTEQLNELIKQCLNVSLPKRKFQHQEFWRYFFEKLVTFDSEMSGENHNRSAASLQLCKELKSTIARLLVVESTTDKNTPLASTIPLLGHATNPCPYSLKSSLIEQLSKLSKTLFSSELKHLIHF